MQYAGIDDVLVQMRIFYVLVVSLSDEIIYLFKLIGIGARSSMSHHTSWKTIPSQTCVINIVEMHSRIGSLFTIHTYLIHQQLRLYSTDFSYLLKHMCDYFVFGISLYSLFTEEKER